MNKNLLSMHKKGSISSPGRICLFGEHQDYLGLPVIPMAINKRLRLYYEIHEESSLVELSSTQLQQSEKFFLNSPPQLTNSPYDYLKVVFQYFWQELNVPPPIRIIIDSNIPIRAGLSSSAALLTSVTFLISNIVLGRPFDIKKIAEIAYICEHDLLDISCGRMDQYASALGGIFHMTAQENPEITPLILNKGALFVIGDSKVERKADIPLKTVQQSIFEALRILKNPNLLELSLEDKEAKKLMKHRKKKVLGVIGVRDNTLKALDELKKKKQDLEYIGSLLSEQQKFLKNNYEVSHPRLDKMCELSEKNGALGAKLTGAGFGGCMFALCDDRRVALGIRDKLRTVGTSFITQIDSGVKKE
ncbi:MAG: hypothetical protein JSV04_11845 [Candidatus Heimdallarchaeota archaeon]|nr:MAG: hypothetical protein JSV04_11845 [Candidatus Heimdallarchaeota archaeon]